MDKGKNVFARCGGKYERSNMTINTVCQDGMSVMEMAVLKFMCAIVMQSNGKYDPTKVAKDAVALADAYTNSI